MGDPPGKRKMGMGFLQVLLFEEREFKPDLIPHDRPQQGYNAQVDQG